MLPILRHSTRVLVAAIVGTGVTGVACGDESRPTETGTGESGEVVVFAAASLTSVFTDLGEAFAAGYPNATVTLNFAASSDLARQIGQGAPADVFASADVDSMGKLVDTGNAATEPLVFATNSLSIIVEPGNPMGITGVADLAGDDVIVVICSPDVPCGRYAAEVFENSGVSLTPKSLEDNVNAVVSKVRLGEADAGIVYATDVAAAGSAVTGVEIPVAFNVVAEYPIVVTQGAKNSAGALAFVNFVNSDYGQQILIKHGFVRPPL